MTASAHDTHIHSLPLSSPFRLESGVNLEKAVIAFQTFGRLSKERDNVIWIFHALTANSNPLEWWPGLVGKEKLFDPEKHFIVCAKMLGSCYGSTGAADINPETGRKYGPDCPEVTIRDIVTSLQVLKNHLGISRIKCGIGGSMGGQQLLEWAVREPELFDLIIPVATNARHSPWGIAFNTAQRMAVEADPTFHNYTADGGKAGLKAARAIGMLSYRNKETFNKTQAG
ncbi:MAG: alpha/beta fold hydrolase, partial [Cyclobacteriaceae bacterium]